MSRSSPERRVRRFKRQVQLANLAARPREPEPAAPSFPPVMRMTTREFEARTDHEGVCTKCRQRNVLGCITLLTNPPAALCDSCLETHKLLHGSTLQ